MIVTKNYKIFLICLIVLLNISFNNCKNVIHKKKTLDSSLESSNSEFIEILDLPKDIIDESLFVKRNYVEHSKRMEVNHLEWDISHIEDIDLLGIDLTIGIRQRNLPMLEEFVWSVSDPTSKTYGNYLTFEEVKDLVSPNPESISMVREWLDSEGIESHELSNSGDFIKAKVSIEKAQNLLHVKYSRFIHRQSKISFLRSLDPYSVPSQLAEHIDFIGGVNHLPSMSKSLPPRQYPNNPFDKLHLSNKLGESIRFPIDYDFNSHMNQTDPFLTPEIIKKMMNVSLDHKYCVNETSSHAIAQFLEEYFNEEDLEAFQEKFKVPKHRVAEILGFNQKSVPGIETALDIQYITAMAPNHRTWIVSISGLHEGQEPFLEWLVNISSIEDLPLVHSISYGDDESSIAKSYMDRVDVEFQKYAAMGRTILFSSGDSGVGCNDQCDTFVPGWPASSRFVLAIGGVVLRRTRDFHMEGHYISGGGFSNHFPRPKYQDSEVSQFLSHNEDLPDIEYYNPTGRAYPDISSFSRSVIIMHKGSLIPIGGTSASCPIIAGLITLLNDHRLNMNKKPVGFFNPLLYKIVRDHPDVVADIVDGKNSFKCCSGFQSKTGWDPVSGLGVPNWPKLLKYSLEW